MNDLWVLSLLAIPIAFWLWVLAVENRYLDRRVERLQAKLDKANLQREAAFLGCDPVECEECHLPGDCPLCGAS